MKCHNDIHHTDYAHQDVIEEWGICEECGKYKYVVVGFRGRGVLDTIGRIYVSLFKSKSLDIEFDREDTGTDTDVLDF